MTAPTSPEPTTSQSMQFAAVPVRHVVRRQLFWFAAGFILVSACLIALALSYVRMQAIESGELLNESLARVIEEQTTRTLQTTDQRLELAASSLAQLDASGGLNERSARVLLREQIRELPFVRAMWVMDAQGRIIHDSDVGNIGVNLADRAYFQIYRTQPQTGFYIGTPVRSRTTGNWLISAARPLRSASGSFTGVIVAALEPPYFDKLWRTVDLGVGGSIALLRQDGMLMMRSPFDEAAMGKSFHDSSLFRVHLPHNPAGSFQDASPVDGKVRLFAYRTLSARPELVVVVGQSYELLLAPWRQLASLTLAIWVAASATIIVLCVFLNKAWQQKIRTDERLQQMAQRLVLATEAADVGVWDWNLITDQWYVTPTYFTMLGYEPEEGFGNRELWLERVHPQDRPAVVAMIRAIRVGADVPYQYEARLRHADGSYRWVSVTGRVLTRDDMGQATRIVGVRLDITASKHAEEALRAGEARYRELFDSNPHPMWVYELETLAFLAVNDAAVAHYGYSREEFLAMTIRDIRPPEDFSRLADSVAHVRAGLNEAGLWRHRRKDGSIILVEISSHSLMFGDRASRLILAHDVTARQLAEEKLRLSEENLAITLQSIGDAVIATDATGLITRMNTMAERLTGWPLADAAGRPLAEVFHIINAQTRALAVNPVQLVMERGEIVGLANHTALLARDGHEYQIFDSAAPIRNPAGQIVGVVLVFSDATQQYRSESELRESEFRWKFAIEGSGDGLWDWDMTAGTMFFSRRWKEMLGFAEDEIGTEPQNWEERLHPEDRARVMADVQAHLDGTTALYLNEHRVRCKDGSWKWVLGRGLVVSRDARGKPLRMIGTNADITARKLAEQQILASQEALRESALHTQTILDNMADCVITINVHGLVESFNKAAGTVFGYAPEEVLGRNVSMLMPEPHRSHHDGYLQHHLNTGESRVIGIPREVEGQRKDGTLFPLNLSVSRISHSGQTTFIGIVRDITQHRKDVEEIRRLAFYDPLTGLPNRRLLMDRLGQAMVTSARAGQHGALMFLDLDHFKQLNDTLGHDMGDVLLQQVAARLQSCVREGDSVARLGGDEFVVLLEALSSHGHEAATQAEGIANKVLDAFGQTYSLRGHAYEGTPSIGIVVFMGDHETMDELLKKADVAMYQAKSAGRNTARFFDPAMQAAVAAHDALEKDMRRGLAMQEFVLHYQIQVKGDGIPTGAEALVRWNHAQRGLVPPAQFIGLAEESGMILPLGQWVLETACNQLVQWASQPATAHWTMAVNVSAFQFAQADFVSSVAAALKKTGANPRLLKLELTESMLVNDVEDVIVKMNEIKSHGVCFSLDDFGTGYSSLSYLKRLPLDQLKIDYSFVRDILTDPSDAVIARTILALGHSLGLTVIAEGVETADQRDFLAGMGCDAFQGFYFGRPAAAEALAKSSSKNSV